MEDLIKREDAIEKNKRTISGVDKDRVNHHWYAGYVDGLTQAIDNLAYVPSADVVERKQGEWIPCSERLPTLNEDGVSDMVLLCWSDGQMTVGAYQGNRTFCGQAWPVAKDCRVTVVAWQPLPKPWKGADDDAD